MPIRVLHVATRHRVGGAEQNLLHTVARELERGFVVHVAVGADDLRRDFPSEVRLHLLAHLVREVSPFADWLALRSLKSLIREHDFDVVHSHQSKAGAVARMAARQSAPVVVHTVHMSSFGPAYGRLQNHIFLSLERRLARFTDQFIFVGSDVMRRYVAARVAHRDRSILVRSPITNLLELIDLRRLRADGLESARVRIEVPPASQVILMVGALDPRKRQGLAIRSLAPLLATGSVTLVIAGEGPERNALQDLCVALGVQDAVCFTGFVRDVKPYFAAADVFVQTSTLEGVPQTVVQGLAAGVPVVATEVDGLQEADPRMTQMSVLPADGAGMLETVRRMLDAPCPEPIQAQLLDQWLPSSVDAQLSVFHDWLEHRVNSRRRPHRAQPSSRTSVPVLARRG